MSLCALTVLVHRRLVPGINIYKQKKNPLGKNKNSFEIFIKIGWSLNKIYKCQVI